MAIEYTDDIKKMIANMAKLPGATDDYKSLDSKVNGTNYNTAAVPAVATPTAYDPTADISKLKEMQRAQTITSLNNARQSSLSNLSAEKATIAPTYYNKRNEASTGSQLQAKNFAEFMANRGSTNSGTNAQAELSRNVALQGNIGNLQTAEANAFADIARRESDVNNAYNNDVASSMAGIETNALNQLIAAQQQNYQNALNQYNTDRNYNYQVGRDNVADNRYNTEWNYQTGRDGIADNRYNQQWDYNVGRDKVQDTQWQNQFDLSKTNADRDYALQLKQLAASRAKASNSSASSLQKQLNSTYTTALNKIMDMKKATKDGEDGVKISAYSPDEIINYAQNLGLPDEYIVQLLNAASIDAPVKTASANPRYVPGSNNYKLYSGSR